jgi:hypothetical protein
VHWSARLSDKFRSADFPIGRLDDEKKSAQGQLASADSIDRAKALIMSATSIGRIALPFVAIVAGCVAALVSDVTHQLMPIEADGRPRYRIKSISENIERVVTEDQLSYSQ